MEIDCTDGEDVESFARSSTLYTQSHARVGDGRWEVGSGMTRRAGIVREPLRARSEQHEILTIEPKSNIKSTNIEQLIIDFKTATLR